MRIALRCNEEVAKILVLVPIVFIFVYLGFEHSIANMATFSMAMLGGGVLTMGEALHNLFFSTVGNVVGGVLLVGLPFIYLIHWSASSRCLRYISSAKPPHPVLSRAIPLHCRCAAANATPLALGCAFARSLACT